MASERDRDRTKSERSDAIDNREDDMHARRTPLRALLLPVRRGVADQKQHARPDVPPSRPPWGFSLDPLTGWPLAAQAGESVEAQARRRGPA
jgi:hypothetical protein